MTAKWWISPTFISLLVLVLQNSTLVVMTRYSRVSVQPSKRYYTSTLVLNQEIVKMIFCIIIFCLENRPYKGNLILGAGEGASMNPGTLHLLWRVVFERETLKLLIPAALFTMQNYLLFIGLSNLDVDSFQVWSQMKLLSTAVFSVLLLRRRLHMMQWVSLFALTFGVLLTQVQSFGTTEPKAVSRDQPPQYPLLGVFSCVLSGLSSSFAGVYFEKVVKTTAPSLAVRNIHLSLFGIPFAVISLLIVDVFPTMGQQSAEGGKNEGFDFWRGYDNWLTIGLVFIHALGGLLVAIVVKYADNIMKGFATGVSVAVSGIMSFIIWGEKSSPMFLWGCLLITMSTVMYHLHDSQSSTR